VRGMQFYGYCRARVSVCENVSALRTSHLNPCAQVKTYSAAATCIARMTSRGWLACSMAAKLAERNQTACSNRTMRTVPTTCSSCRLQLGWHGHHHRLLQHRNRLPATFIQSDSLPTVSRAMFRAPLPDALSSARQKPLSSSGPLPSCGMPALCRQRRVHRVHCSGEKLALLQHLQLHVAMRSNAHSSVRCREPVGAGEACASLKWTSLLRTSSMCRRGMSTLLAAFVHLFHLLSKCSTGKTSQSMKRTDTSRWCRRLPSVGPISMRSQHPRA